MTSAAKSIASRIRDWPEQERPREKLIKNGAESVSSAELIAILLGQGSLQHNAVDLGKHLIKKFTSLEGLAGASITELQQVPGIGPAKAVTLLAAFQLFRNLQRESAEKTVLSFNQSFAQCIAGTPVIDTGHNTDIFELEVFKL